MNYSFSIHRTFLQNINIVALRAEFTLLELHPFTSIFAFNSVITDATGKDSQHQHLKIKKQICLNRVPDLKALTQILGECKDINNHILTFQMVGFV